MENDVILDISTRPRRSKIKIDGVEYELAVPQDFKLKTFLWMANVVAKVDEENALSDRRYTRLIDDVFIKVASRIPRKIQKKLTFIQKLSVITAFFGEAAEKYVGDLPRPTQKDGDTSSRDSSDSTEGIPESGSIQT